ncbi:MAG: aminotransferase class I/II-fold pyridoxal phosphate-dependent enzyme [Planctomycetaceae bacterium]|jgi:alanine-synthesizing transaminase|nr:aminotransferase class I/II-fold pyridoxal phosphate-dependent enzyme [Planctomycetaceae bacterium]
MNFDEEQRFEEQKVEFLQNNEVADDQLQENTRPFTISVSERVKRLPPYLFAELNKLKYEKRKTGADVIDLGMGSPSDPPHHVVTDKLIEVVRNPKLHAYSHARGLPQLRKEVAARYVKYYGVRLDPETQTIVCIGSKEGLSHLCLALLGAGDTAIVPSPYFPAHLHGVMLASASSLLLDVRKPEKLLSNIASTCQHFLPRPKVLILNYPHNPTTTVVEPEFYVEIVKLAKRYGFMVISDMAYGDICFDNYHAPSFLAAPGAIDVGVETTTMSKGYNMAGWRIGFCCGNAEIIRALATIKTYYDYGVFSALQIAAIAAIRHTDHAVEAQAKVYQKRRDILCSGLERIGWNIAKPKASMFVWQQIPTEWAKKMSSFDFAMKLLKDANVVVSPGSAFGESGEGFMRLALVEKEDRLRQAVRQIGRALRLKTQ